jgi:hypothetical protein
MKPPGKITPFPLEHPPSSTMSFFRRPDYTSDTTQFIEQLRAGKPGLEQSQRQGRALLWDKQIDREFQAKAEAARVPQQPYVYQTGSDHT